MGIEPWRWDNLEPSAMQKYGKKKQTCRLTPSGKIIIILITVIFLARYMHISMERTEQCQKKLSSSAVRGPARKCSMLMQLSTVIWRICQSSSPWN